MSFAGAVILVYVSLTYRQVEIWSSPLTLWTSGATRIAFITSNTVRIPNEYNAKVNYLRDALAVNPSSGILHNNLAVLYFNAGHINGHRDLIPPVGPRPCVDLQNRPGDSREKWRTPAPSEILPG